LSSVPKAANNNIFPTLQLNELSLLAATVMMASARAGKCHKSLIENSFNSSQLALAPSLRSGLLLA
jgi:hypothetical protein